MPRDNGFSQRGGDAPHKILGSCVGSSARLFWSSVFLFGMTLFSCFLLYNVEKSRVRYHFAILLVARATPFTVNPTVSKMMALEETTATLIVGVVLKIHSGVVMIDAFCCSVDRCVAGDMCSLERNCNYVGERPHWYCAVGRLESDTVLAGLNLCLLFLILGNSDLLGDVEIEIFGPSEEIFDRAFYMIRRDRRSQITIEAITDPSEGSIDVASHDEGQ